MFERLQRWIAAQLGDVPDRLDELEADFERIRTEWADFADIQARREERQRKRDLKRAKELASEDDDEQPPERPAPAAEAPAGVLSKADLWAAVRARRAR